MAFHNQVVVLCGKFSKSAVEMRKLIEHEAGGRVAFTVIKNEVNMHFS